MNNNSMPAKFGGGGGKLVSNPYNIKPEVEKLETKIIKETQNLRKLIYIYDNGNSHVKIFEEANPETKGKKYWCSQWGINYSSRTAPSAHTVSLIVPYSNADYILKISRQMTRSALDDKTHIAVHGEYKNKNTNSFSVFLYVDMPCIDWQAEEYVSRETLNQLGISI